MIPMTALWFWSWVFPFRSGAAQCGALASVALACGKVHRRVSGAGARGNFVKSD
jgi:hypothetical protein